MKRYFLLLPLACLALAGHAQKKAEKKTLDNLKLHVSYLASDKLEGRRTGTPGEQLAAAYIAGQMQLVGLTPKGEDGFMQTFILREGREAAPAAVLSINEEPVKDFVPLPFSAQKTASGEVLPGVNEVDNIWLINVKEEGGTPHTALDFYVKKAKEAKKDGASGIIFYNGMENMGTVQQWLDEESEAIGIPAVWTGSTGSEMLSADDADGFQVNMKVAFQQSKRTGTNVAGYIDNGAAGTIVIGAHYDHLGLGEDNNSLAPGEQAVHNGADDNASGIAALLELGRMLKASKLKSHNYLLIAFSGEEQGLFGSKYFTEHATVPVKDMNYMVNMDMIGRLGSEKGLQIGGIGTSPSWGGLVGKALPRGLKVQYDSSGTGPSDHISFYRKSVPVLFFFTGIHSDYHKPGDDAEKINYEGELTIVKLIYDIIAASENQPKLTFTQTREMQMGTSTRFTVTLGIMPDYTYNKGGLRVDDVSEGKPAQKAGMQTGDVITALGEHAVSDIETYMKALSAFKKGDSTQVKVKRGSEDKIFPINF